MKKHIAHAFVAFIALATLVRLFFSVDLTDESNYAAHLWAFLQEGKAFHSDLFIHGNAAILISPIGFLYKSIFGPEAIVLFLRLCFFILMLVTAWAAYFFYKKAYPKGHALLAASFYIAFIPFSLAGWSYNNVAALGLPLSLFFLFSGGRKILAAGAIAAIVSFVYPPLFLVYLVAHFFTRQKIFIITLLTGIFIGAAFVVLSGYENLSKVLAFAQIFAWNGGTEKIKDILLVFFDGFMQSGLWLLLPLSLKFFTRYSFIILCVFLAWISFVRMPLAPVTTWLIYAPLVPLFFYIFQREKESVEPPWYKALLILGFLASAVFGYTSSNIMVNCALGMILTLQLLLLEVLSRWKRSYLILAAISLFLCIGNYRFVYRDASFLKLNTVIESGPFRYLFTTPERANMLHSFQKDFKKSAEGKQTVFASYFAPAYFITNLKPVTGMLFIHDIHWPETAEKLILHRTIEKQEWPDLVVTKITAQSGFNYQFENFFLQSTRYQLLTDNSEYRIFGKK